MMFWGIEVKPGQTVSCDAGDECAIHISQAALGETKRKGSENVVVSVKVDGNKMVIGNLSAEKHPQFMCDLFIGNEFELSHSSKTTSVFLCGYKADMPTPYESDSGEDEDEDEEIPNNSNIMGKHMGRPVSEDGKRKRDSDDDMDLSSSDDDLLDSFSDDDSTDSFSSDDDMDSSSTDGEDESSDDDGSDESPAEESSSSMESSDEEDGSDGDDEDESDETDEDDEITNKPESNKMTAAAFILNTSSAKEAKPNEKTRKSSGTHACKYCSKTFRSDAALLSHQKAKHPAK